jgi:signal transduction histidine kinase
MTCKRWLKSATAQKRIDVRVGWVPRRKTNGDREQVQRLLYNLLGNAIKYADPAETSRYVAILATKTLRGLDLVFEDNGIGIPSGEEDDIFIRGVRGTNVAPVAAEGSGLGLAFCRKIATAHGWEITLRRRAKPTVFVVGIEDPVA